MSNWDVASNAWDFGTSQIKIWIDGENLKYKKSLKPENIIPRSSITGVGFKAGNLTSILTIFTSGSEINLRVPTRARSTNLAASISGFFNGDATQGNQASRKAGKSSTLRNASIVGACVFILLIMIGMSGSGNSKKKTLTKEEIKSEVSEYLNRIQLAEQPSIDATAKFLKVSEDRYAGYDAAKAAIAKAEYVQETIENLKISDDLPDEIRDSLKEARKNLSDAYFSRQRTFRFALEFYDTNNPSALSKLKESSKASEYFINIAASNINKAKKAAGL